MHTPGMARIDGTGQTRNGGGTRVEQASQHGGNDKEGRHEAEREDDNGTPAMRRTLATIQARLNLAGTTSLGPAPRGTCDTRALNTPLLRRRRSLGKRTTLPAVSMFGRAHNTHSRAMPVTVDGNAGAWICPVGRRRLVPMRIFANGSGRLGDAPSLRGNHVAHNASLLRHRSSILGRSRFARRTRRTGGLSPNYRVLGGHNLFDER